MIALRLCWPIFALWYMCQETSQLVSTHFDGGFFKLVKGVKHGGLVLDHIHRARTLAECASMCVRETSCSKFNFGTVGECELLSAAASCRYNEPEWTHGYNITGRYTNGTRKTLLQNIFSPCKIYIYIYLGSLVFHREQILNIIRHSFYFIYPKDKLS